MKKILLAFLVAFSFSSIGFAQDFSLDELVKLRTGNFTGFETYVHDKGYKLAHLEYNNRASVFENAAGNIISFCHDYDEGQYYHSHISIKYETANKDEYERLKKQIDASMTYYRTRLRRYTRQHYLEHIYTNDNVVVHLFDITYKGDDTPYYQIEVKSIYSGADRQHWRDYDYLD